MNDRSFNLCAIIPVYNHQQKIANVVQGLLTHDLTCILIDDGSEENCAQVLQNLAAQNDRVYLEKFEVNQGKGAAVCAGLVKAFAMKFTHALQIDADGQHDLNDVPAFIARAKQFPESIISGSRTYEAMPPARRSGRKLTDFWVRINTLSPQIKDSMCGYRLYPLAKTVALIQNKKIGRRMDFDTDILVRLYWSGLSVENIETHIIYHDDIPSHFDVWKDNVRISWMHTRLFFGMLIRIPQLLLRR